MPISVAILLLITIGEASLAPQTAQATKAHKPVITVSGCMDGSWLRVNRADPVGSYAERYKLRGSKQLLTEMRKEYQGHSIEVTGTVTDTGNTTHTGTSVDLGKKTRVTVGAKDVPQHPSGTDDPILDVQAYRDLKETCK